MHLTATETAVLAGTVPALAGAGLGTVLGAWLTGRQHKRDEAKTDRERLRQDAAALLAACTDVAVAMQALRNRHLSALAQYRRIHKVLFDFSARIDPGAWKDWRTARDSALEARPSVS